MNILDQITESQVSEWMLAKLASLRESDQSFTSISIDARHYKCMPDPETTICMHADEACAIHEPDFHAAESVILEKLYGNAMRRAASLRKEADELQAKASELESRAAVASGSPNNRPQRRARL